MSRRLAFWALLGILVLGIALRAYHVHSRSLWFDESFSWRLSEFPVMEIIQRTAADTQPPLYYIVLKGWTYIFGSSLWGLRSLSLVAAALTIIGMYLLTTAALTPERTGAPNRGAGLVAALLFALSAWQIPFAWETRMYALAEAAVIFSSWMLLTSVRQSRSSRSPSRAVVRWIIYAFLASALAYLHTFGLLVLAAHAIFVLATLVIHTRARLGEIIREPLLRHALLAGCIVTLLYLPWLPIMLHQAGQIQGNFWVPPIDRWSIPETFHQFFMPTNQELSHDGFHAITLLLPLLATAAGAVWLVGGQRQARDGASLIALGAAVPIALAAAISLLGQSLYVDRYLIFAHGFILAGVAALITRLRPAPLRRIGVSLVVVFAAWALVQYGQELDIEHRPGLGAAMETVASQIKSDEPVFAASPYIFLPTTYYAQEVYNGKFLPRLVSVSPEITFFAGGAVIEPNEVVLPDIFMQIPAASFWLIDTNGFYNPETTNLPGWQQLTRQTYPEVFPYQAEVIVSRWSR